MNQRFKCGQRMGLVLDPDSWALEFGLRYGRLSWWPPYAQELLVKLWNPIACRLRGHRTFQLEDRPVTCMNCDKCWYDA